MAMATTGKTGSKVDIEGLNKLLRGELSAVETYTKAIEKFDDPNEQVITSGLQRIRDEHSSAATTLRQRVLAYGGEPSESSGIWGAFANTVTGTAKLIGPETTLEALKQGELTGIDDYNDLSAKGDLCSENRSVIRSELLPRCQEHVRTLDMYIKEVKHRQES